MDTRDRITEQAAEMFFRYGIRSITMDEIAESLGMSKRTLYESFATKEDLLRECMEWKHKEGLRLRDEIEAQYADDPLEIIHQHFRHVMMVLNQMHPNFLNDLQKYHARLWKEHARSKQDSSIAFTRQVLEKGVQKGIFRQEADMEILSRMIHTVMPLMTAGTVFNETRFPRAEVVRQVFINFIRGLATPHGLTLIDEKFNK